MFLMFTILLVFMFVILHNSIDSLIIIKKLEEFRQWLADNGFDPKDKSLTIGHPQVAQVDLKRSFGTEDYSKIWTQLSAHMDVYKIRTGWGDATYNYRWNDTDYAEQQIRSLK